MGFQAIAKNLSLYNLLASVRDTFGQDGRYWRWGKEDNFPNTVIDSVNDSGTARECIDKMETFIAGEGIRDKEFLKTKANPDQTWGELLEAIDRQLAYFDAIPIQVKFNAAGKPVRYYMLPVQHIRKRYDGDFIYSPELGDPQGFSMYRNYHRKIIPPFGTNKTPADIRKLIANQRAKYDEQLGELLYIYTPGVGLNYEHYPIPKYSAGLHDINADAALSLHEESQVSNSFKGGVLIPTHPLDRTQVDDNGKTEYDRFEENIEDFCSPDGSPVFHYEVDVHADQPFLKPEMLNIEHQMNATEKATDRVGRKVCRLFGVPPVLCGFATAGKLGENQELVNHMKLFKLSLKRKWKLKERMFETLFPGMSKETFETVPLDLFDFVPDKVIDRMTTAQLNEAYNLPPDEEGIKAVREKETGGTKVKRDETRDEINEHLKTLTGKQQQQLDRVVRKFNKEELNEQQAVMQLTSGFGFKEDEAKAYLGIEIEENGADN